MRVYGRHVFASWRFSLSCVRSDVFLTGSIDMKGDRAYGRRVLTFFLIGSIEMEGRGKQ